MPNTKSTVLRMPITNVFGQGDYSVTLHPGSEKSPVNLLLDTGSSTLVVKNASYQATQDENLTPSSAVQEVNYGVGGWNFNKACFRSLSQLPQCPNQSIITFPLLNNDYVILYRSVDKTGVVMFAQQKMDNSLV